MERHRTSIVAHRGGADHWPENSLTAVRGAIGAGVDGIEIDVHLTGDDHVVVIHDPTLERTTFGAGSVRDRFAAELAAVRVRGCSAGVPLLSEVLEEIGRSGVGLSVELKSDLNQLPYPRLAELIVEQVARAGLVERTFVHAFDWSLIEQISRIAPELETGCNVDEETMQRHMSYEHLLDDIQKMRARDINADFRLMDEDRVNLAHQRGLGVTLWTVNEDEDLLRFLCAGVENLCTDRPLRALELRRQVEGERRPPPRAPAA